MISICLGLNLGPEYEVHYGYENNSRFKSINYQAGTNTGTTTFAYLDNSSLIQTLTFDTGLVTTYTYEPARNLKTSIENRQDNTLISKYAYVYNELGQRTSVVNTGSAFAASGFNLYDYNTRNELIQSDKFWGSDIANTSSPNPSENSAYTYDTIGNRLNSIKGTNQTDYLTTSLNQYIQTTGASAHTFTHDDDGNMIAKDGMAYTWNAENRLIAVEPAIPVEGNKKTELVYDYMGRRVQKTVYVHTTGTWNLEKQTRFIYDGWNLIKEIIAQPAQPVVSKYYVWGLDLSQSLQGAGGVGGLLAVIDGSETYNYCFDGNGNVGQLINAANGIIDAHYEYDTFGSLIRSNGAYADDNKFRFSTKLFENGTSFYYYGYRYYDADSGRWISRDPSGEGNGLNLYGFINNQSINTIDGLGLKDYKIGSDDPELPRGLLDAGDHGTIPGTPGMWIQKQTIMKSLSFVYYIYPDAARHLWHYLSGAGTDYTIRLQKMIDDVNSVKNLFDIELGDAQWFVQTLPPGKHKITSDNFSESQIKKSDNKNWFLAVAGYSYWGKGIASVCNGVDPNYKYVLQFEYKINDPYDWHIGKVAGFEFLGTEFDDRYMRDFHLMGYAKEFLLTGSVKKTVKWNNWRKPVIENGWSTK